MSLLFEDSSNALFLKFILQHITLEICYFFNVIYFFEFIKHAILMLLNTIILTRRKMLVNNLLLSEF